MSMHAYADMVGGTTSVFDVELWKRYFPSLSTGLPKPHDPEYRRHNTRHRRRWWHNYDHRGVRVVDRERGLRFKSALKTAKGLLPYLAPVVGVVTGVTIVAVAYTQLYGMYWQAIAR